MKVGNFESEVIEMNSEHHWPRGAVAVGDFPDIAAASSGVCALHELALARSAV